MHMDVSGLTPSSEAAEELGISRSTLTRWIQWGWIRSAWQVPGYRGRNYFTREEIDRVKAERERDSQAA